MLADALSLLEAAYRPFWVYCLFDGGQVEVSSSSIRIHP